MEDSTTVLTRLDPAETPMFKTLAAACLLTVGLALPAQAGGIAVSWTEWQQADPGLTKTAVENIYGASATGLEYQLGCPADGDHWTWKCYAYSATGTSTVPSNEYRLNNFNPQGWVLVYTAWNGHSDHYGWYEKCLPSYGC